MFSEVFNINADVLVASGIFVSAVCDFFEKQREKTEKKTHTKTHGNPGVLIYRISHVHTPRARGSSHLTHVRHRSGREVAHTSHTFGTLAKTSEMASS